MSDGKIPLASVQDVNTPTLTNLLMERNAHYFKSIEEERENELEVLKEGFDDRNYEGDAEEDDDEDDEEDSQDQDEETDSYEETDEDEEESSEDEHEKQAVKKINAFEQTRRYSFSSSDPIMSDIVKAMNGFDPMRTSAPAETANIAPVATQPQQRFNFGFMEKSEMEYVAQECTTPFILQESEVMAQSVIPTEHTFVYTTECNPDCSIDSIMTTLGNSRSEV